MRKWIANREHWRWFSLLCYAGLIAWMGAGKLHRGRPALFFIILIGLTAGLMVILRFLYRGEHQANQKTRF